MEEDQVFDAVLEGRAKMQRDQVFDPVRAPAEAQRDQVRSAETRDGDGLPTARMVRIRRDTLRTLCTVAAVVTCHLRDAGLPLSWDDGIDAAVFDATAALGKAAAAPPLAPGVVCGKPARYRCSWFNEPGVTTDLCSPHRMTRRYGGVVGDVHPGARCQAVGDAELGQG